MLPGFFGERDSRGGNLRVTAQEVSDEFFAKFFHAGHRRGSRQRVHGVFHRVRGKNLAVIAVDKAGPKVSFEENVDNPFAKIVMVGMPLHLCEADSRFTVTVFGQRNHRISFPDMSYNREGSGAAECESAIRRRARET